MTRATGPPLPEAPWPQMTRVTGSTVPAAPGPAAPSPGRINGVEPLKQFEPDRPSFRF
jgi:hypothetical protein